MARSKYGIHVNLPKLKAPRGIRTPAGWGKPRGGIRSIQYQRLTGAPAWWKAQNPDGTHPEWKIYQALVGLGLKAGRDFLYKPQGLGVDFLIPKRGIALIIRNVSDSSPTTRNPLRVVIGPEPNFKTITISESDAIDKPSEVTKQALAGIDQSGMHSGNV